MTYAVAVIIVGIVFAMAYLMGYRVGAGDATANANAMFEELGTAIEETVDQTEHIEGSMETLKVLSKRLHAAGWRK